RARDRRAVDEAAHRRAVVGDGDVVPRIEREDVPREESRRAVARAKLEAKPALVMEPDAEEDVAEPVRLRQDARVGLRRASREDPHRDGQPASGDVDPVEVDVAARAVERQRSSMASAGGALDAGDEDAMVAVSG